MAVLASRIPTQSKEAYGELELRSLSVWSGNGSLVCCAVKHNWWNLLHPVRALNHVNCGVLHDANERWKFLPLVDAFAEAVP